MIARMKTIPLTKGKCAIVDDEDFPFLSRFNWQLHNSGNGMYYAEINVMPREGNKRGDFKVHVPMHAFLIKRGKFERVEFVNKNTLDYRKKNLMLVTYNQNIHRAAKRKGASSKYKGVSFNKRHQNWIVGITYNRKRMHLGYFLDEKQAAKVYNKKAKELYGELAYQNKIVDN